ncbi:META domain-containing protein [Porphyromonas macacae]|nr:META domain-containing protein [Porphyromonas macacae]
MLSKQQTTWQLLSIKGDTVFKNMNTTLLMDPSENKFSGKAPCNIYGGTLTIDENGGIKFSEIYSTLAACENIMQEQEYIARLQAVKSYLIKDDKLYLYDVERADVSDSVGPIIEFAMPKK